MSENDSAAGNAVSSTPDPLTDAHVGLPASFSDPGATSAPIDDTPADVVGSPGDQTRSDQMPGGSSQDSAGAPAQNPIHSLGASADAFRHDERDVSKILKAAEDRASAGHGDDHGRLDPGRWARIRTGAAIVGTVSVPGLAWTFAEAGIIALHAVFLVLFAGIVGGGTRSLRDYYLAVQAGAFEPRKTMASLVYPTMGGVAAVVIYAMAPEGFDIVLAFGVGMDSIRALSGIMALVSRLVSAILPDASAEAVRRVATKVPATLRAS